MVVDQAAIRRLELIARLIAAQSAASLLSAKVTGDEDALEALALTVSVLREVRAELPSLDSAITEILAFYRDSLKALNSACESNAEEAKSLKRHLSVWTADVRTNKNATAKLTSDVRSLQDAQKRTGWQVQCMIKTADAREQNKHLSAPMADFALSVRTVNCLKNSNLIYVGDVVQKSARELLRQPNFGHKSLKEITDIFSQMNVYLEMDIGNWSRPVGVS